MMKYISSTIIQRIDGTAYSLDLSYYKIPIDSNLPFLKIENEESLSVYDSIINLKLLNGKYVVHHESEPALIIHQPACTIYQFYVDGVTTSIEYLPCDDEVKLMLKLKYGSHSTKDALYYRYFDYL